MKDQQGSNRISSGVIAAVSAAVVAVGGGVAWLTANTNQSPTPTSPSQTIKPPASHQRSSQVKSKLLIFIGSNQGHKILIWFLSQFKSLLHSPTKF